MMNGDWSFRSHVFESKLEYAGHFGATDIINASVEDWDGLNFISDYSVRKLL